MLSGFNTNIRHRGVLFHVQSEDSGRDLPHIITHLFHGGNILFSEKSSYADHLGAKDVEEKVRELMEGQHKMVLKRLRAGDFDSRIQERLGAEAFDDGDTRAESRTVPPVDVEPAAPEPPQEEAGRTFGQGIVSEKPLDEVILNYLVENARNKRKRQA